MRNLLMLLVLLSALQYGEAQSPHLKFDHFTIKEGLPIHNGKGPGLSITNDMVVKGHAGNITVDTKEGKYTIFTIYLPLT